jgi:hypothetical protein
MPNTDMPNADFYYGRCFVEPDVVSWEELEFLSQ